jgi:hypothetical protein
MSTFTADSPGRSVDAPASLADNAQVKEDAAPHNVRFWVEKALVGYFYWYDELYGKLHGISQEEIDMVLLEEAKELGPLSQGKRPKDMQRFYEVMEHFQAGAKTALYFKMAELLRTCAGARRRVTEAITFRLERHLDVILGSPACDLPTHVDVRNGKPTLYSIYQFPIHQYDYHDTDWQFALGTFGAMWEPLASTAPTTSAGPICASQLGDNWIDPGTLALTRMRAPGTSDGPPPAQPRYAKVWGSKIWRWHSETDRASERVHQASFRLVQSGRLKNFWVIAEPCIVEIGSGMPVSAPA